MADPHRLDEVVITAPKSVGELINGNDVPPPPPPITEPPVMVEVKEPKQKVTDFLRSATKACRAANESCDAWGARMVAPAGAPILDSEGLPTGRTGTGFCAAALYSASVCVDIIGSLTINEAFCVAIKCPSA
jgi:hypothetical protein